MVKKKHRIPPRQVAMTSPTDTQFVPTHSRPLGASHVAIFPTIRAPEMACPRLIGGERVSSLVVTKAVALSA